MNAPSQVLGVPHLDLRQAGQQRGSGATYTTVVLTDATADAEFVSVSAYS